MPRERELDGVKGAVGTSGKASNGVVELGEEARSSSGPWLPVVGDETPGAVRGFEADEAGECATAEGTSRGRESERTGERFGGRLDEDASIGSCLELKASPDKFRWDEGCDEADASVVGSEGSRGANNR